MQIKLAWELLAERQLVEAADPQAAGWISATLVGALLEELERLRDAEGAPRVNADAARDRESLLAADILLKAVEEHRAITDSTNWNEMDRTWRRVNAAAHAYHLVRSDAEWRQKLAGDLREVLTTATPLETPQAKSPFVVEPAENGVRA